MQLVLLRHHWQQTAHGQQRHSAVVVRHERRHQHRVGLVLQWRRPRLAWHEHQEHWRWKRQQCGQRVQRWHLAQRAWRAQQMRQGPQQRQQGVVEQRGQQQSLKQQDDLHSAQKLPERVCQLQGRLECAPHGQPMQPKPQTPRLQQLQPVWQCVQRVQRVQRAVVWRVWPCRQQMLCW